MQIRNLHFIDRKKYIHETAGFNFRLTNLQCAVGLGQLAHIEETITQRKRVAYSYNKYFADIDGIQTPTEPAGYSNVYWYYGIQVKKNYTEVLNNLEAADIEYRHFFHPLHKQPFINSTEVLINSEKCFENGILLPIFNILSEEQIKYIATTIKQAL
jgi:dTDP-4-amino-4,6-dideoxygalactose transaminase